MQIDITHVLDKIKSTTDTVKQMDAQDVTTENMKVMNHCKKYSDDILECLKTNLEIDLDTFALIKDVIRDYRNALNEKHGEAQGKSIYIAANSDDINEKYAEILQIGEAVEKSIQLKNQEANSHDAKNILSNPTDSSAQNNLPPAGWQVNEMNALSSSINLLSYCIKTGVGVTCHATAAIAGVGAGLAVNLSRSFANRSALASNSVNDYQTKDFVERNQERVNVESAGKLVESMKKIQELGVKFGGKSLEKGKEASSVLLNAISEGFDMSKDLYLESCISLSEKSKLKFHALNEGIKKVTENLSESINTTLGNVSGTLNNWLSKIKEALKDFTLKLKTILQSTKAHNVAKGDMVVDM